MPQSFTGSAVKIALAAVRVFAGTLDYAYRLRACRHKRASPAARALVGSEPESICVARPSASKAASRRFLSRRNLREFDDSNNL